MFDSSAPRRKVAGDGLAAVFSAAVVLGCAGGDPTNTGRSLPPMTVPPPAATPPPQNTVPDTNPPPPPPPPVCPPSNPFCQTATQQPTNQNCGNANFDLKPQG